MIYKDSYKSVNKSKQSSRKNLIKFMRFQLIAKEIKLVNMHKKRCPTSLIIRIVNKNKNQILYNSAHQHQ